MDFLTYTSFFGVATIANVMKLEIETQDFDSWEKQLDKRHVFLLFILSYFALVFFICQSFAIGSGKWSSNVYV